MTLTESVLVESKSARDNHLEGVPHDRATEILNKAKALIMAAWRGAGVTTTEQIADYYEVESSVVRHASKQHRDELVTDGWREVKGSTELKSLRSIGSEAFSLPESTTRVAIWTPRASLRLGLVLTKSEIAKAVRTCLLDIAEYVVPAQSDRLRELELQVALYQAQADAAREQRRLSEGNAAILSLHGQATLALIQGNPHAVVPVTEYVDRTVMVDDCGRPLASFDGVGICYLTERYKFGKGKKANDACRAWLKSCGFTEDDWVQEMTAHSTAKFPRDRLGELDQMWAAKQGSRQRLLGE